MKQGVSAASVSAQAVTYTLHKLNREEKESCYNFYCYNEQVRKDTVWPFPLMTTKYIYFRTKNRKKSAFAALF